MGYLTPYQYKINTLKKVVEFAVDNPRIILASNLSLGVYLLYMHPVFKNLYELLFYVKKLGSNNYILIFTTIGALVFILGEIVEYIRTVIENCITKGLKGEKICLKRF